jgi:glutathione S-transferase
MYSDFKLYGSFTSPYVRHCRIALLEAKLECAFQKADNVSSAELSPMQKVPFFSYQDNGLTKALTDSSAIIRFIREQAGQSFNATIEEFNDYCAATTLLDSAINLFFIEKEGVTAEQNGYLLRQQNRLQSGLKYFEEQTLAESAPYNDAETRLACFLDWGIFRNRISLKGFPKLECFLAHIQNYDNFSTTKPYD